MLVTLMPSLPKITDNLLHEFMHTDLLELDSDGEWQWSQLAVDFACVINFKQINQD